MIPSTSLAPSLAWMLWSTDCGLHVWPTDDDAIWCKQQSPNFSSSPLLLFCQSKSLHPPQDRVLYGSLCLKILRENSGKILPIPLLPILPCRIALSSALATHDGWMANGGGIIRDRETEQIRRPFAVGRTESVPSSFLSRVQNNH